MKTTFLFQTWPYVAVVLFAVGMALRYLTLREPMAAKRLWRDTFRSARLLQFCLFLLLLGHLVGLLVPQRILAWNSVPSRLYALEILAFTVGLSALASLVAVMWRHLRISDGSVIEQAAESVFLSLLFTALVSGSLIAILFRWGSSWGVFTLTPYALSLLRGRPAVELVNDMPFLVRLHIFSAFATLAALPLSRFAPILIVALNRGLGWTLTPVRSLFDWAFRAVGVVARRLTPAVWIWPEDD
jgi:nitrate reductase gamma subunit